MLEIFWFHVKVGPLSKEIIVTATQKPCIAVDGTPERLEGHGYDIFRPLNEDGTIVMVPHSVYAVC